MNLPAICNRCGVVFNSGFEFIGNGTVVMEGCSSGPCPKCGSMGNVPNGIYKFINGVLALLNSENYSNSDLIYLTNELNKIKDNKSSVEEVKLELEEKSPKFSKVLDLLPKTRDEKRQDFQFWIGTIISLMMFIASMKPTTPNIEKNINIEQVINVMYQVENDEETGIITKYKDVGRNEKCPCGSGLKFKKCHGDWRYELNESINTNIGLD